MHHADGGVRAIEVLNTAVIDDCGRVVAVEGIARDISEQKRAREILARQALEAELLHQTTTMAAETEAFSDSLQRCIEIVCKKRYTTLLCSEPIRRGLSY